jgi:hypothetical protein
MAIWDQPIELRIAAAQQRLFAERCQNLHNSQDAKARA